MATSGSAAETLRLTEHYRRLTDGELIALAAQKEALTDAAQQALDMEIHSRKLTMLAGAPAPAGAPEHTLQDASDADLVEGSDDAGLVTDEAEASSENDEEDLYAEDRKLYEIREVWSEADARRLQHVLDVAGIPFYMGREKATNVDDVTSNFAGGVPVKVMRVGWPWAYEALARNYFPKDEPEEPNWEDAGDVAIRCPRCKSTDVAFEKLMAQLETNNAARFRWKCGACGKEWEDDGVQTAS